VEFTYSLLYFSVAYIPHFKKKINKIMQEYIFSAYYYQDKPKTIKVLAPTRGKAYDKARAKAIRIKNDLDFIELN
jgi:hypothetical protein